MHKQLLWPCQRIINNDGTVSEGAVREDYKWCIMCSKWVWMGSPDGETVVPLQGSHLKSTKHLELSLIHI